LVFSPKLSSLLIDVLFGGRGRTRTEIQAREFTAIESRLLAKTAHLIIDEVTQAFQPLHAVQCCYLRSEQSPLALTCATPTERSVVLHFELDLAGQSADFEICIPYSLLEPIRAKLQSGARVISPEQRREALSRLAQSLQHCKTTVRVELARGSIRAEQALGLGVGDVLTLATHRDEPALVYIEDQPKFRARVGSKAGQWAVTITDEIKSK
ncbi:MAG: FliM/FliN family flagellar motor switch protein, partial [Bdellovibrionales bacterium]|nr:FliM/FliN family flagellar motor switch protein [Bdellovibrionales bacterium]